MTRTCAFDDAGMQIVTVCVHSNKQILFVFPFYLQNKFNLKRTNALPESLNLNVPANVKTSAMIFMLTQVVLQAIHNLYVPLKSWRKSLNAYVRVTRPY